MLIYNDTSQSSAEPYPHAARQNVLKPKAFTHHALFHPEQRTWESEKGHHGLDAGGRAHTTTITSFHSTRISCTGDSRQRCGCRRRHSLNCRNFPPRCSTTLLLARAMLFRTVCPRFLALWRHGHFRLRRRHTPFASSTAPERCDFVSSKRPSRSDISSACPSCASFAAACAACFIFFWAA